MNGLLIVNADDWGASERTTERIVDCFAAGGVTSATAMVHMADSERAAGRALEIGLPTGLHLNLTQPFDGPSVPPPVREAQRQMAAYFGRLRRRDRIVSDPRLLKPVRRCVQDQLDCFRRLYGREPTHVDGHNHVHLDPVVLCAVPTHLRVRTAVHERTISSVKDLPRLLRHHAIRVLHGSTDFMFAVTQLHPLLGGSRIEQRLALARDHSLEIMTHPARDAEHELLRSSQWLALLDGLRLGSFADLA
jgi:predicted glycoside hydrolase/deacetylase ChbG (UPF0249 family)